MFAPPHADGVAVADIAVADIAVADADIAVAVADIAIRVVADNTEDVDAVVDFRVAAVDTAGLPAAKAGC